MGLLTGSAHPSLMSTGGHLGEDCSGEEANYVACQIEDAGEWRELPAIASSGIQHNLRHTPA